MAEKLRISRHPETGLLVRTDGLVHVPKCRGHHGQWTYGWIDDKGYRCISYKRVQYRVHRLVIETFRLNPENLPWVDHIDRDRSNASLDNLRYIDPKGNVENSSSVINRTNYGSRECDDPKEYFANYYKANKEKKAQDHINRKLKRGFVLVPWGKRMVWRKREDAE
jgi:hypothetical protein